MEFSSLFRPSLRDSFWDAATQDMVHSMPEKLRIGAPGKHSPVLRQNTVYGLQSDLPPREELPQPIQEFLQEIDGLSKPEQMERVHDFVNDNMRYPSQYDAFVNDKPVTSNREVIENWIYGDCDNRVQLSAALLRYSGFDSDDLTLVGSNSTYNTFDGDKVGDGGHGTLFVRVDDQHYVMDMNFADVVPVTARPDGHFQAIGLMRHGDTPSYVQVDIDPALLSPATSRQANWGNPDKLQQLADAAAEMFKPAEDIASSSPKLRPDDPGVTKILGM